MRKTVNMRAVTVATVFSLLAPAAFADDASYCKDLNAAAKAVTSGGGVTVPTDVAVAISKCDADSMKVLEAYITAHKGALPKRM